jgi:hypothetical protein
VEAELPVLRDAPCTLEPLLLVLAVRRIRWTQKRDHVEAAGTAPLERVEAAPGLVVERTLDMA